MLPPAGELITYGTQRIGVLTINKVDNHFEVETECLGSGFYNKVLEKFKEYLQDFGKIVE